MAKITKFDLAVVGVTLAFLLGIGLYCWKTSMTTQPYRVEVSQREEIAPAEEESDPPSKLLEGETININTASAAELQRLPGIGEKRAEAIVAWRMEHGLIRRAGGSHSGVRNWRENFGTVQGLYYRGGMKDAEDFGGG